VAASRHQLIPLIVIVALTLQGIASASEHPSRAIARVI
jgi:hypothetical protein